MGSYGRYKNNGKLDVINPHLIDKALNKAQKNLSNKSLEDIYTISFKGYKFNALPFLVNGTEYYDPEYKEAAHALLVCENIEEHELCMAKMNEDKLLDIKVLDSLIPHYSGHMERDITAFLYANQPQKLTRLMFVQACMVLRETILGNHLSYMKFNCENICNTQAFCFYLSVEWVLQNAPEVNVMIRKQLSEFKYKELMYAWCPDDCIHMKYIKGEIDSKELNRLYMKEAYPDGSSVCQREIMSLCTDGAYDGRDLSEDEKILCENVHYGMTNDRRNITELCLAASSYPRVSLLLEDIEKRKTECEVLAQERDETKQRLKIQRESVIEMKNNIKDLESENAKLRTDLSQVHTDGELLAKIKELEEKNDALKKENNKLFDERLKLKQLVSAQKKQLRTLKVKECDDEIATLSSKTANEETFDFIKSKRM